jgi:tetratricopeptide (TPR) repeat protein
MGVMLFNRIIYCIAIVCFPFSLVAAEETSEKVSEQPSEKVKADEETSEKVSEQPSEKVKAAEETSEKVSEQPSEKVKADEETSEKPAEKVAEKTSEKINERAAAASNHIASANALAKKGEYRHALDELDQAIAKDAKNSRAYKVRGHVYYAIGNYALAVKDFEQVRVLAPSSANAYVDLAIAQSMMGNHKQALANISYALSLKPDSSFAQAVRDQITSRSKKEVKKKK